MQLARIWTRVTMFISNDSNYFTMNPSVIVEVIQVYINYSHKKMNLFISTISVLKYHGTYFPIVIYSS